VEAAIDEDELAETSPVLATRPVTLGSKITYN